MVFCQVLLFSLCILSILGWDYMIGLLTPITMFGFCLTVVHIGGPLSLKLTMVILIVIFGIIVIVNHCILTGMRGNES